MNYTQSPVLVASATRSDWTLLCFVIVGLTCLVCTAFGVIYSRMYCLSRSSVYQTKVKRSARSSAAATAPVSNWNKPRVVIDRPFADTHATQPRSHFKQEFFSSV